MYIRVGFEIALECSQPTPMIALLNIHHSHASDIVRPDHLRSTPTVPITAYRDSFGNWCSRLVAPAGRITLSAEGIVAHSGQPDRVLPQARQIPVETLPSDTLMFLLGSRYCETDRLSDFAWSRFGHLSGWPRAQAICDFVHGHLAFSYPQARATRTAWEAYNERVGVCRDFAHLALTLCRCVNIPARYCTGYLGDIGVPPDPAPMDFSGWFEAYLDGAWHVFDARHNRPRIGRILIGIGRDAADVPLTNTFGPNTLAGFRVWAEEMPAT